MVISTFTGKFTVRYMVERLFYHFTCYRCFNLSFHHRPMYFLSLITGSTWFLGLSWFSGHHGDPIVVFCNRCVMYIVSWYITCTCWRLVVEWFFLLGMIHLLFVFDPTLLFKGTLPESCWLLFIYKYLTSGILLCDWCCLVISFCFCFGLAARTFARMSRRHEYPSESRSSPTSSRTTFRYKLPWCWTAVP